ncbi:hypothetical protein [Alkalicoccobacillus gibsonii]|jgi:hypothetical protein|uniref:hypothetical protein n=1 Tax=Alkalicoccobacillus gibsonii TaxID=79881 RepID=UPI0019340577|nr:hypothetical protein [Alkalicoccobacillus gibsonii]MBM0067971.1 hypothetical protein [Alkalicoccobacillus gibsonii]
MRTRYMNLEKIDQLHNGLEIEVVGTDHIKYNGAKIGEVGGRGTVRLTHEMRQRHPLL